MIKNILFALLISCSVQAHEIALPYTKFVLPHKLQPIEFLLFDNDLSKTKPVLLFVQGSLPIPIIILDNEGNYHYSILENFDIPAITQHFHLICITSPFTPLEVKYDQISPSGLYVPDTSKPNEFDINYWLNDRSEVYEERAIAVIHFLNKQKWVERNQIHAFGHSQGSRVLASLGSKNKYIKSVGLFGYNPMGRIEQFIRAARKDAVNGKITWEQADSITQENIAFMQNLQNPDTLAAYPYYHSWSSFSKSTLTSLLNIKQPLYIAYGSMDNASDLCDMLPLLFIEQNKSNYEVVRYAGLEHNFFPIHENGSPDYENGRWKEVIHTYIQWILKQL